MSGKVTRDKDEAIECPVCGYSNTDLWDFDFGGREICETWCGDCDAKISLTRHVSVSYECRAGHQDEKDGDS
jgi:hypothetical protein